MCLLDDQDQPSVVPSGDRGRIGFCLALVGCHLLV